MLFNADCLNESLATMQDAIDKIGEPSYLEFYRLGRIYWALEGINI
jgi:hypothetical protein